MRVFLAVLALICLALPQIAAQAKTLEDKVKLLQDSLMKRPFINLNQEKWRSLVRTQPRNYSMIVMFTALGADFQCTICKPAHEEFSIVANSYRYAYLHSKNLYFAVVDYADNPQAFQQLNLNTAPVIYYFPARSTSKKLDQMDFQRSGFGAEAIAKFIQERTDVNIRVMRPPNYAGPIVIVLLVMLIVGMLYMRRDSMDFMYSPNFWGFVCVVFVLAFQSGQMWNHIRSPPFLMNNPQTRQTSFIHGSTQYQLIAETYIVFALYGLISLGMIFLNESTSGKLADQPGKRRFFCYAGIGLVVIFFSLLLSVFRSKYQGYPYHFLFN
ncbi:unnamed protein product [Bursaphelenchus okinawaensis]|uniref:Magnesium transporter protein 1 n=1 Tax=Bursaphelenchus okinawaensis TaxID=465554 RepID=A0A811KGR9_9BILA|nr:unnamed protein product [Bursaphelenchus okinawaensis]CAG9102654.1 unnamed protein product [Bursaphelenchus okinawaensis]